MEGCSTQLVLKNGNCAMNIDCFLPFDHLSLVDKDSCQHWWWGVTLSVRWEFCCLWPNQMTMRPHHRSSDGTTLAACASAYHIYVPWNTQSCMSMDHSTWWTWWCPCHNLPTGLIYIQLKTGNSIYHTFTLPSG